MSRRAGARPDNPWQRATALGKRLRVSVAGDTATWTHPDAPYAYTVEAGGCWALAREGAVLEEGAMDSQAARLYVDTARNAEPRRLAAWKMLNAIALEGATWEGPNA